MHSFPVIFIYVDYHYLPGLLLWMIMDSDPAWPVCYSRILLSIFCKSGASKPCVISRVSALMLLIFWWEEGVNEQSKSVNNMLLHSNECYEKL